MAMILSAQTRGFPSNQATWARTRRYSSHLRDPSNPQYALSIRLPKVEVLEAMLYIYIKWALRPEDLESLRTAHLKLLLQAVGYRRNDRASLRMHP